MSTTETLVSSRPAVVKHISQSNAYTFSLEEEEEEEGKVEVEVV